MQGCWALHFYFVSKTHKKNWRYTAVKASSFLQGVVAHMVRPKSSQSTLHSNPCFFSACFTLLAFFCLPSASRDKSTVSFLKSIPSVCGRVFSSNPSFSHPKHGVVDVIFSVGLTKRLRFWIRIDFTTFDCWITKWEDEIDGGNFGIVVQEPVIEEG